MEDKKGRRIMRARKQSLTEQHHARKLSLWNTLYGIYADDNR